MMDINYLFKTITIVYNAIMAFATIVLLCFSFYLLVEHFTDDNCGKIILYIIANTLVFTIALIINILGTIVPCCDKHDFFGVRGSMLCIVSFPLMVGDVIMGIVFKYNDNEISECLNKEYEKTHVLYFGFYALYYYSICACALGLVTLVSAYIMNITIVQAYKNSPFNHQKLLEETDMPLLELPAASKTPRTLTMSFKPSPQFGARQGELVLSNAQPESKIISILKK